MSNLAKMASRIELWPVDRLKPYERNARTHSDDQVTKLAASITEFGFTNPVLVDSADGIIAGHGRLMAAKLLNLAEVPVIVLDHLTDAQRRAYILADNRLALDAGWDHTMLAMELADLQATADIDLALTGFSESEIDELMNPGAGWESDIETVAKAGENTDGIEAKIVVKCGQMDKDDVINTIQRAIAESGIEGVTLG